MGVSYIVNGIIALYTIYNSMCQHVIVYTCIYYKTASLNDEYVEYIQINIQCIRIYNDNW